MRPWHAWRALDLATRPVHPEAAAAVARRWAGLPDGVRTPAQTLGRIGVGCEGTHGVFPACNLTCSPCYHSADANHVRVDGDHTVAEVRSQLGLLRRLRGPRAHAQLIGGEVTLLAPDDHAAALLAMRAAGREPMSMTHGDVDADYLEALVTGPDGRLRLPRVSFAAHFDSLMRGRRGVPRPRREADLHEARLAFVAKFADLRRRTGLRYHLAHNMTVTAANLGQVGEVVASLRHAGFAMLSFQPAARVGDERRWARGTGAPDEPGEDAGIESVWARIEEGVGGPVPWQALQWGDPRCNRTAFGVQVGATWVPLLDPADPADLAFRDAVFARVPGLSLAADRPALSAAKVARLAVRHPALARHAAAWVGRFVRRAGGVRAVAAAARRGELSGSAYVVHAFMDAAVVRPAWAATGRGETAAEPEVRAAQERLAACVYSMAHPETGELVPACVQHSVLDPDANRDLRVLLPMPTRRRP